jgi:hypothetical protein
VCSARGKECLHNPTKRSIVGRQNSPTVVHWRRHAVPVAVHVLPMTEPIVAAASGAYPEATA